MTKHTLYDLLNPDSDKNFKSILSKYGLPTDPSLFEKKLTYDRLLEKIYRVLNINPQAIESSVIRYHSLPPANKQNDDNFFKNLRLYCIVKALYAHSLFLKALKVYTRNKKLKKIIAALRAYIARVSAANHARLIAEYEAEKAILDQRLKDIINLLKYENMHAEAEKQMIEFFETAKFFQEGADKATLQRNQLLQSHSDNFYHAMRTYQLPNNGSPFLDISNEQMLSFAQDFEIQDYRLEKKIRNNQERENACHLAIRDIEQAITDRKLEVTQKQSRTSKGVYATSFTTLLSLNKRAVNDPEILALTKKKNDLQDKIQQFQSQRTELLKKQSNLPLTLAQAHQLDSLVEMLSNNNSEHYNHFIKIFHHQRDEKRELLQEQRLLRRNYRNQIKQIQNDAQQLHEVDQQAKEIQGPSVKTPSSLEKTSENKDSLDTLLTNINNVLDQTKRPPLRLKL